MEKYIKFQTTNIFIWTHPFDFALHTAYLEEYFIVKWRDITILRRTWRSREHKSYIYSFIVKTTQYILQYIFATLNMEERRVENCACAVFEIFQVRKRKPITIYLSGFLESNYCETIMESFQMEIYSIDMTNGSIFAFKIKMEYIFRSHFQH